MKKTIQDMIVESVMSAFFLLVPQLAQADKISLGAQAKSLPMIEYIDADGTTKYIGGDSSIGYSVVNKNTTMMIGGWWVVTNEVPLIEEGIECCYGDVKLILADGCKLNVRSTINHPAIAVEGTDNSLTIYGQTAGTGRLIATSGQRGAGIGGGYQASNGKITINGGIVTAMSIDDGAGIGGGKNANGSNITINGGIVKATGWGGGAGIGGGCSGNLDRYGNGSNITINGGVVEATGGIYGAGIGNGSGCEENASNIKISPRLVIKASNSNPPMDEIAPFRTSAIDIASNLANKQYVTITAANHLTFTAEEDDSTIVFGWKSGTNVQCSSDDGKTWSDYDGQLITLANRGDKVAFRGSQAVTFTDSRFSMSGKIAASGSVTSLIDGNGNDPGVILPERCCFAMFFECNALTTSPELPATNLVHGCYDSMFCNCSALTEAPELPATVLAEECYCGMFWGCASLKKCPVLPATLLPNFCYQGMFYGCSALKDLPTLAATTVGTNSCEWMFKFCNGIIVNMNPPGNAWSISAGTQTAKDWNLDMFVGTGGSFTGDPEVGTTYYVGAKKEQVGDVTLYRYGGQVGVSYDGELTKEVADTIVDKSITNLIIGAGVTKVGNSAFKGWRTLRDVTIGTDCTEVGAQAFYKCPNITNVVCKATEPMAVGDYAFYRCNSLQGISFLANPTWGETPFSFYSGIYMKDGLPEVYAIPSVRITGCNKQTLMGTNDLSDPNSWEIVTEETKGNYHFFKIVLGE